jgi:hypothetical protein
MAKSTTGQNSVQKPKRKPPKSSWKKGQSGNPKGRAKKGETFSDIIREAAAITDIRTATGARIERKRAVVEKLYSMAIQNGDLGAIKYIIDRVDPAPGTEPGGANAQDYLIAFQAIIARATIRHPGLRKELVTALESATVTD